MNCFLASLVSSPLFMPRRECGNNLYSSCWLFLWSGSGMITGHWLRNELLTSEFPRFIDSHMLNIRGIFLAWKVGKFIAFAELCLLILINIPEALSCCWKSGIEFAVGSVDLFSILLLCVYTEPSFLTDPIRDIRAPVLQFKNLGDIALWKLMLAECISMSVRSWSTRAEVNGRRMSWLHAIRLSGWLVILSLKIDYSVI